MDRSSLLLREAYPIEREDILIAIGPASELEAGAPDPAVTPAPDVPAQDQPVSAADEAAGVDAYCSATIDYVREAVQPGSHDANSPPAVAQARVFIRANELLQKNLGIDGWRAAAIPAAAAKVLAAQNPDGDLVSYCLARAAR